MRDADMEPDSDTDIYPGSALVVDDDTTFREVFIRTLSRFNWEAEGVEGGPQALQVLKERTFDVIFLDLWMPEMNGVETLARIREFDLETPVVIVTAYPDENLISQAREISPITLLPKPFTQVELAQVLRSHGRP